MGMISGWVAQFKALPTGGKVALIGAGVGAAVLGWYLYQKNQASAASNGTTSTSTTPGSWFSNAAPPSSQGASDSSGTTSLSASGAGAVPTFGASAPAPAPVQTASVVPQAISSPTIAPPYAQPAVAAAAPAIVAASTSVGTTAPPAPPPAPPPVYNGPLTPSTSTATIQTNAPQSTAPWYATVPTAPKNTAGLASNTGTVGRPVVNSVNQTVRIPVNVRPHGGAYNMYGSSPRAMHPLESATQGGKRQIW